MKVVFADVGRCVGCRHCEMACAVEHSSAKDLYSMLKDEPMSQPRIKVGLGVDLMTFPNKCQHCDPAPCEEACPTNAIYRDSEFNSTQVEAEKCISCGMCAMVCPYDAITYQPTKEHGNNKAYKCDQCPERLTEGKNPACVEACVTGALVYAEINQIIKVRQTELFKNVTSQVIGKGTYKEAPVNIKSYNKLQEKVAQLGPLPSSEKKEGFSV